MRSFFFRLPRSISRGRSRRGGSIGSRSSGRRRAVGGRAADPDHKARSGADPSRDGLAWGLDSRGRGSQHARGRGPRLLDEGCSTARRCLGVSSSWWGAGTGDEFGPGSSAFALALNRLAGWQQLAEQLGDSRGTRLAYRLTSGWTGARVSDALSPSEIVATGLHQPAVSSRSLGVGAEGKRGIDLVYPARLFCSLFSGE